MPQVQPEGAGGTDTPPKLLLPELEDGSPFTDGDADGSPGSGRLKPTCRRTSGIAVSNTLAKRRRNHVEHGQFEGNPGPKVLRLTRSAHILHIDRAQNLALQHLSFFLSFFTILVLLQVGSSDILERFRLRSGVSDALRGTEFVVADAATTTTLEGMYESEDIWAWSKQVLTPFVWSHYDAGSKHFFLPSSGSSYIASNLLLQRTALLNCKDQDRRCEGQRNRDILSSSISVSGETDLAAAVAESEAQCAGVATPCLLNTTLLLSLHGLNVSSATAVFTQLEQLGFVNADTKSFVVSFFVKDAPSHLWVQSRIIFKLNSKHVTPFANMYYATDDDGIRGGSLFRVFSLFELTDPQGVFVLCLEILFVLFAIFEAYDLWKKNRIRALKVWHSDHESSDSFVSDAFGKTHNADVVYMSSLVVGFTVVCRIVLIIQSRKPAFEGGLVTFVTDEVFDTFGWLTFWDSLYHALQSFQALLFTFRLIRILAFFPSLSFIPATFDFAAERLSSFAMVYATLLLFFSVFTHVSFGESCSDYSTFYKSCYTNFIWATGQLDLLSGFSFFNSENTLEHGGGIIPVFFILFFTVLMTMMCLNVVIAILIQGYVNVEKQIVQHEKLRSDFRTFDRRPFPVRMFLRWKEGCPTTNFESLVLNIFQRGFCTFMVNRKSWVVTPDGGENLQLITAPPLQWMELILPDELVTSSRVRVQMIDTRMSHSNDANLVVQMRFSEKGLELLRAAQPNNSSHRDFRIVMVLPAELSTAGSSFHRFASFLNFDEPKKDPHRHTGSGRDIPEEFTEDTVACHSASVNILYGDNIEAFPYARYEGKYGNGIRTSRASLVQQPTFMKRKLFGHLKSGERVSWVLTCPKEVAKTYAQLFEEGNFKVACTAKGTLVIGPSNMVYLANQRAVRQKELYRALLLEGYEQAFGSERLQKLLPVAWKGKKESHGPSNTIEDIAESRQRADALTQDLDELDHTLMYGEEKVTHYHGYSIRILLMKIMSGFAEYDITNMGMKQQAQQGNLQVRRVRNCLSALIDDTNPDAINKHCLSVGLSHWLRVVDYWTQLETDDEQLAR